MMATVKRRSLIKAGIVTFALVALAVAIVGCSTDAPLAPSNNGEIEALNAIAFVEGQYGPDLLAEFPDSGANADDALAKSWWLHADADYADVGQDGGTIYLDFGNSTSELVIPAEAVCGGADYTCFVRITAKAVQFNTPYGPVTFYGFRPNGLQFAEEAILYLSTNLEEGAELRFFWYNPASGKWELEQAKEVDENGVVEFEVKHFSKYAIS